VTMRRDSNNPRQASERACDSCALLLEQRDEPLCDVTEPDQD
jgi:hypothetical protein